MLKDFLNILPGKFFILSFCISFCCLRHTLTVSWTKLIRDLVQVLDFLAIHWCVNRAWPTGVTNALVENG